MTEKMNCLGETKFVIQFQSKCCAANEYHICPIFSMYNVMMCHQCDGETNNNVAQTLLGKILRTYRNPCVSCTWQRPWNLAWNPYRVPWLYKTCFIFHWEHYTYITTYNIKHILPSTTGVSVLCLSNFRHLLIFGRSVSCKIMDNS